MDCVFSVFVCFPLLLAVGVITMEEYWRQMATWRANSIGDFNPETNALTAIDISGFISDDNKYHGGVLAPNCHIYMVLYCADNIGDFNPSTGVFAVIDISAVISHDQKYQGGVLAPNGHIYMVAPNGHITCGGVEVADAVSMRC